MSTVIVLFNLKPGVDAADYERWAIARDLPNVNSLASVKQFRVMKASGLMGGGDAPYQYVEILEVHDLDGLRADVKSETMQGVAREFREFAEAAKFIVTESIA